MNIMKHKIDYFRITMASVVLLVFAIAAPLLFASSAHAALSETACMGLQEAVGEDCGGGAGGTEISGVVQTIVNILTIVVGLIAVIMIIIGGIRYITSGGDPGSIKGARDTVIYAVVGIIVVAIAQLIVRLITGQIGVSGGG